MIMLDASAASHFGCTLDVYNTVVQGYTGKKEGNITAFGTAFHKFRAAIKSKVLFKDALNPALEYYNNADLVIEKAYLTSQFLTTVCVQYFAKYTGDTLQPIMLQNPEGKIEYLIELQFAFTYTTPNNSTVTIVGTIDDISQDTNNHEVVIVDAKTTSVWDSKSYFRQFRLNTQLRFYCWALTKYKQMYPNSFLKDLDTDSMAFVIDGVFYKSTPEALCLRSDVIRINKSDVEEFEMLLNEKIDRLCNFVALNKIPPREGLLTDSCRNVYGACKYAGSCIAPDLISRQIILDQQFMKKQYNPLNFQQ